MFIKYFILIILTLLMLIFHDILLLNEETLVLVCFTCFVWLFSQNVGNSIKDNLNDRRNKIKVSLGNSFQNTIISLNNLLKTQAKFWSLLYNFRTLSSHYLKFVSLVPNWFNVYNTQVSKIPFYKRLNFIRILESQVTKLLILILTKKLEKVSSVRAFFTFTLSNPHFLCLHKISIRELIQNIKVK